MSNEMFYLDENGKKQDRLLHEEILGDDDAPRIKSMEELREMHRKAGIPFDE